MDNGIQVVVAVDHPIMRDALRKLLEAEQGFEVVGEASNGDEAVEITQRVEPDILLLDLAMPGPAREVLRQLSDRSLPTRTIILAASIKRDELVKALQLGARGIVMKESVPELLTNAIRTVIAGRYWVGRESVSELIDALQMRPRPTIQSSAHRSRTRDYVDRDCRSHQPNRKKYGLSQETVKRHLTRIFAKLGVGNRPESRTPLDYLADGVRQLLDHLRELVERFRRKH